MVQFSGVSKNEMTLYLQIGHTETAVQIACDMCVTQHKGKTNVEKPTEILYIKKSIKCIINCPLKNNIYTLKLYIHPAETHRLLKFLFHIMGRLVPAHNKLYACQRMRVFSAKISTAKCYDFTKNAPYCFHEINYHRCVVHQMQK